MDGRDIMDCRKIVACRPVCLIGLLVVSAAFVLGACGRKGNLEAPPGAITSGAGAGQLSVPVTQRKSSPGDIYSTVDSDADGAP